MKPVTTPQLADKLNEALANVAIEPSPAVVAPVVAETQVKPVFIDAEAARSALNTDADNTTPLSRAWGQVIFEPTIRQTYDQTDRNKVKTGVSRKVADVRIQMGTSRQYMRGAISLVQPLGAAEAFLRLSVHWNPETKQSCILSDGGEGAAELDEWKDATLAKFAAFAAEHRIDLGAKTEAHKHTIKGVSII